MFTVHCTGALACFKDTPNHFLSLLVDHSPLFGESPTRWKNLQNDIILVEGNVLRVDHLRTSVDDVLFSSFSSGFSSFCQLRCSFSLVFLRRDVCMIDSLRYLKL